LVLNFIPLVGYLWRVGTAVSEHGFSQETLSEIARHTNWLKRYFTGPPTDKEMTEFFYRHRTDLERSAFIFSRYGYCHHSSTSGHKQECERMQERTRTKVGLAGPILINSAYRAVNRKCGHECYVQVHIFYEMEPQNWWRSWNGGIKAWQKSLLFVPPLKSAALFGLNPNRYPDDPLEVMRRNCIVKDTLNFVPPELENKEAAYLIDGCAVKHIEGNWFIALRPVIKE